MKGLLGITTPSHPSDHLLIKTIPSSKCTDVCDLCAVVVVAAAIVAVVVVVVVVVDVVVGMSLRMRISFFMSMFPCFCCCFHVMCYAPVEKGHLKEYSIIYNYQKLLNNAKN